MPRFARVVAPGLPHHITQRGNRCQDTFFGEEDYHAYVQLLGEWCARCGIDIWAYWLMPNHVHLIVVPESEDSLRRAIGEAHRRYTRRVNFREGWRGHLWQGRFASFVLSERYLLAATRYVELNPVRARLVEKPWAHPWSSVSAHLAARDDGLVKVAPLLAMAGDWKGFLSTPLGEREMDMLRKHERTGRPFGEESFVTRLEAALGRTLQRQRPGRKPRAATK